MSSKILKILPVAIVAVATVFSVLSIALDKWEHENSRRSILRGGLWHVCSADDCIEIETKDRAAYNIVRSMMFGGLLFLIGAVVCTSVGGIVMESQQKTMNMAAAMSTSISGTFTMCGFSVYAEDIKQHDTDYGACFVLAVISWLLAWSAAAIVGYKLFTTYTTTNNNASTNQQQATITLSELSHSQPA